MPPKKIAKSAPASLPDNALAKQALDTIKEIEREAQDKKLAQLEKQLKRENLSAEMLRDAEQSVDAAAHVIAGPSEGSRAAFEATAEFNPLIEQSAVQIPQEGTMNEQANFAVGLIETQGFTAVFEAIDTAVKTANVEVLAREKLGGGYITVVIKGDVAAVRAAVEAGSAKVASLGRLVAAHVIPSPSQAVLSLLPIK